MSLTLTLADEYRRLWADCKIRSQRVEPTRQIVAKIMANWARYESVAAGTVIPWWAIALIHRMEAGGNFLTHLHNGDPLTARTVHYPPGRPPGGDPPYTWEESARDAITLEGWPVVRGWSKPFEGWVKLPEWSLATTLFHLEMFNGSGYRKKHPEVLSPYLWAGSNLYTRGKYTADGHFDPLAISKQIGAAVILKELEAQGTVVFA
jgi:lysozyme family protein